MGTTNTSLTVTIITKTPDEGDEDLLLEAEIVDTDNNGETTYYVGKSYILRLFKSTNISSVVVGNNIGTVVKKSTGLTTTVPYEGEDAEYVTFTGSDSADLSKVYQSGFTYTPVGSVFTSTGESTTASLTPPTVGSKSVTASKEIYGVFSVSYVTKYDTYEFNSPVVGPMLIFFIGTSA